MPGPISKSSDKSGDNSNISPQISQNILNIPDTRCVGQIKVFCCRSSSDTQILKLSDCEVRTVSKGSGQAFSSKYS